MWQLYSANGIVFNFWYFLSLSLAFYLGITIFSIPFVAMGYEMSDDFHELESWLYLNLLVNWVIAPWIWVIIYDPAIFIDPETGTRQLSIIIGVVCTISQ